MMDGPEKSDLAIVAGKPANKASGPAKHVPDAEPGKRVTGAGTHTANNGRHTPEVGEAMGRGGGGCGTFIVPTN